MTILDFNETDNSLNNLTQRAEELLNAIKLGEYVDIEDVSDLLEDTLKYFGDE